MEISEVLQQQLLENVPEDKETSFEEVHSIETAELLDNFGYISYEKNNPDEVVTNKEIIGGIEKFRSEYLDVRYVHLYQKSYDIASERPIFELTEDELNFLEDLSSLEGEFELHAYSLLEIRKNPILTRVLNFRLNIISVIKVNIFNEFDPNTSKILDRLSGWFGVEKGDRKEIIRLLGDITALSNGLISKKKYRNSSFKEVVYFYNEINSKNEKEFKHKDDDELFKSLLIDITPENREDFKHTIRRVNNMKAKVDDDLNRIVQRIIQLRLYLYGTYDGKLDDDMGEISFRALNDFFTYVENLSENDFPLSLFLIYIKRGYWAINANYLFKKVMVPLDEKLDKIRKQDLEEAKDELKVKNKTNKVPYSTISEALFDEIFDEKRKLTNKDQNEVLKQVDFLINEKEVEIRTLGAINKKRKTRGFKKLLVSVKIFLVKTGEKLLDRIKSLFSLIKNGVLMMIREIKKFYNLLKAGISFLFSTRLISTTLPDMGSIVSDYDVDFDSVTVVNTLNESLIKEHQEKNTYLSNAVEEASEFIGIVLFWAIKIGSGPYGWIKLGIYIIKKLAEKLFSYQRFSFQI